jgi:hypothetical protein
MKTTLRAAALLSAVGFLAGCGGGLTTDTHRATGSGPSTAPSATSLPVRSERVPPGDPGRAAPEATDPGEPTEPPEAHPPRTVVPGEAMLDAETVAQLVGGTWSARRPALGDRCAMPFPAGAVASRSVSMVSTSESLTETLTTHRSAHAAVRAVDELSAALRDCGWSATEAPVLGEAAVQATRTARGQPETVVALAAEGVAITLLTTGMDTAEDTPWASVLDLALGSSCAALAEGCH